METIVIDGKTFKLVPVESTEPQIITPASPYIVSLDDFRIKQTVPTPPLELADAEERKNAIRIIDPGTVPQIEKAQSQPYDYRDRFLRGELTHQDVEKGRITPLVLRQFTDMPEVTTNSGRTPDDLKGRTWGFYGAGVTFDA